MDNIIIGFECDIESSTLRSALQIDFALHTEDSINDTITAGSNIKICSTPSDVHCDVRVTWWQAGDDPDIYVADKTLFLQYLRGFKNNTLSGPPLEYIKGFKIKTDKNNKNMSTNKNKKKTIYLQDEIYPVVTFVSTEKRENLVEDGNPLGDVQVKTKTEVRETKTIARDVTVCAVIEKCDHGNVIATFGYAVRDPNHDEFSEQMGKKVARDRAEKYIGALGKFSGDLHYCSEKGPLEDRSSFNFIWDDNSVIHRMLQKIIDDMEQNFSKYVPQFRVED